MSKKSFNFLKTINPSFRKKIDGCYANFAILLDKYKKHLSETPKEETKSPADFLKQDLLLEMMVKDFNCYQEVLLAMETYAKNN